MTVKTAQLEVIVQPQAYFHELVSSVLGNQRLKPQPETEVYLVHLLEQFMSTDRLYPRGADGTFKEEPLALMVKEAMEQPEPSQQRVMFRQVGDVSLYVAGFFPDSLNRKLVDIDYYIGMGGTAYHQVAMRAEENVMRSLYSELAEKFAAFVEVLSEISEKTGSPRSETDLLRLYEVWLRTRSDRAAKALASAGILPNANVKRDIQ